MHHPLIAYSSSQYCLVFTIQLLLTFQKVQGLEGFTPSTASLSRRIDTSLPGAAHPSPTKYGVVKTCALGWAMGFRDATLIHGSCCDVHLY
jgi:hypothetical protein